MVPEAGLEPARIAPSDFKSDVFTNFTTQAWCARGDSNSYDLRHWNLSPACLPISPLAQERGRVFLEVFRPVAVNRSVLLRYVHQ